MERPGLLLLVVQPMGEHVPLAGRLSGRRLAGREVTFRTGSRHSLGRVIATVRRFQVTFDCREPKRPARFWCEVLGYVVPPPPAGFATWDDVDRTLPPELQGSAFACTDPSGVGPRLLFLRVPEGKVVKNRLHLDVRVGSGSDSRCEPARAGHRLLLEVGIEWAADVEHGQASSMGADGVATSGSPTGSSCQPAPDEPSMSRP